VEAEEVKTVRPVVFDDLRPQEFIDFILSLAEEFKEVCSHNEATLDFLDAHEDELAGREYDMAVADAEAIQRRARSAVEATDKTIVWLTLQKGNGHAK
jgi:hypothetical protein